MENRSSQGGAKEIRKMYEKAPYPDLGARLKTMNLYWNEVPEEVLKRKDIRYLDVGCGTGHYLVGVARDYPEWKCYGTDLSEPSLQVCRDLAQKHKVKNVSVLQGDYSKEIPFDGTFDIISALGTIHHCEDPVSALKNVSCSLSDGGYLFMHLYGARLDKGKFDIKEILNILEPDLSNIKRRFELYDGLMKHKEKHRLKTFVQQPLIDILMIPRNKLRNIRRRMKGYSWSPAWNVRYREPSAPWIDHFCNPCEKAYEVPEVIELVDQAGMKIVKMLGHGKEYPSLIPEDWQSSYEQLSQQEKWKLSELLAFGGGSFNMILQCK